MLDCDNHVTTAGYGPVTCRLTLSPGHHAGHRDGKVGLLAGDRLVTSLDHELDKAHAPGSLREVLRQMRSGNPDARYELEDLRPEWLERGPRLVLMDQQGVESAIMYPGGIGLLAEAYVRGVDSLYANLHAYNRWNDETWGFDYQHRIYAPAVLSLRDLDHAVEELDFVLGRGARFILLHAGPAYGRSPGDPYFDPLLGPYQRGQGQPRLSHRRVLVQRARLAGLGPRPAAGDPADVGVAVAAHLWGAAHRGSRVRPDLRQPVRPLSRHPRGRLRVRGRMGAALSATWTSAGEWAGGARGSAAS